MNVPYVKLEADAFMVCLTHALSTEREEIMGLCIGEVDENRISHISTVIMLRRSDKRQDRVEISPEQLSDASTQAEILSHELGRPMRVVGWYHSHPHITVWPSHVDVQTQAMYQMMDECFVGLIFSVFNEDKKTKQQKVQLTCFQSINQSPEGEPPQHIRLEVPICISRSKSLSSQNLNALVNLPRILTIEEHEAYSNVCSLPDLDVVAKLHNSAVYTKSVCHVINIKSGPLIQMLENRLQLNRQKIEELTDSKEKLEQELKNLS